MKTRFGWLVAALALVVAGSMFMGQNTAADKNDKVLRHVVLFKFKADVPPDQVEAVEQAFAALPKKIDAIKDFEWGLENSPEGLAAGFTHGFLVTFADEKGREIYLPHPAHEEFKKLVGPKIEKVLVFDYWTKK